MQLIPIFDTSAIIHLSKKENADPVWRLLKPLLPKRGCPLSHVTVLELFHGLSLSDERHLAGSLKPVNLASRLSRRKVLLSPIPFFERERFGIRHPGQERSSANLRRWLGIAMKPAFKTEFSTGRIEGMNLEKIRSLFDVIAKKHCNYLEQFLDRLHPPWRSERQKSGSPIPEAQREQFKREYPTDKWKAELAGQFLGELGIQGTTNTIADTRLSCDAYFTFTVSLLRSSIVSNYGFEERPNDFYDGMHLLYLSRPSFCLVTEDKRLIARVHKSSQSCRILTIDQFASSKS